MISDYSQKDTAKEDYATSQFFGAFRPTRRWVECGPSAATISRAILWP